MNKELSCINAFLHNIHIYLSIIFDTITHCNFLSTDLNCSFIMGFKKKLYSKLSLQCVNIYIQIFLCYTN